MGRTVGCETCKQRSRHHQKFVTLCIRLYCPLTTTLQYGKNLDWKNESYTTHDVASVFRRYLTQMPVSSSLSRPA